MMRALPAVVLCLLWLPAFAGTGFDPNPKLTPGAADPGVTQADIATTICRPGYSSGARNVSAAGKRAVFAEYGVDPKSDRFEIDHLISLELGGTNAEKNLWPQSYTTKPWNAHLKDRLENRLHKLVCARVISLAFAQHAIATGWRTAYARYVTVTVATK